MEAQHLRCAELRVLPWAADYWPFYLGGLGRRYADPHFPRSRRWDKNHAYAKSHPARLIIKSGCEEAINLLSPSEKYDFLIGDERGTLTAAMWEEGAQYFANQRKVERWMGICHGWAPASYMVSRPSKEVIVLAADGRTRLRFYPEDIKALVSLLWANADLPVHFIGERTDVKKPRLDRHGRVINRAALDPNPAVWHLVAVNQIGVAGRSFVIDMAYDYEVWNQPVCGYEYSYFNPQTMQPASTLKEATVSRQHFTADRFGRQRSKAATSFVGILMKVRYVTEIKPVQSPSDVPDRCRDTDTSVYKYDLELDAKNRIIGGEWHRARRHPDFLWTVPPGTRPERYLDIAVHGDFTPGQKLPQAWQAAAVRLSRDSVPLAQVVNMLVRLSNP
jgi:hypothetical protein